MDEETYQNAIRAAWEEHDTQVEALQQEQQVSHGNFWISFFDLSSGLINLSYVRPLLTKIQTEIERCFEEMTALKFEKLAEVKANYDIMIKRLKPEQHADKIQTIKSKKEAALKKVQEDIDTEKKEKIAVIKICIEAKKKELQMTKDSKLEAL